MTDWENYTRLCSLKDNVSSTCSCVQTSNYRAFHRLMFQTPYAYMETGFLKELYEIYGKIALVGTRFNTLDLITDLIDTPPQVPVQTSGGMAMNFGRGLSVSGSIIL